jgi:hypothetical protein
VGELTEAPAVGIDDPEIASVCDPNVVTCKKREREHEVWIDFQRLVELQYRLIILATAIARPTTCSGWPERSRIFPRSLRPWPMAR